MSGARKPRLRNGRPAPQVDLSKYTKAQIQEAYKMAVAAKAVRTVFVKASTDKREVAQLPDDLLFDICDRIAEGESLREICKEEGMPRLSAILAVAMENATTGKLLQQAMRMRAIALGDEVVSDAKLGMTEDQTAQAVASRRLMIDSKKWYASKLAPALFGDKIEVDSKTQVNIVIRRFESDAIDAERAPDA